MKAIRIATLGALVATAATVAHAAGPDLKISDLFNTRNWGQVGDTVAYSIGTEICNFGDEDAIWIANTNEHPVIAQNMYRHKDGAIEQIGIGWLKHGFSAVNGNACGVECIPPGGFGGDELGVGCSDPYDASLNGDQGGFGVGGLGPRFEVNAATGDFNYPYFAQGQDGDAIYKRLQVKEDDLLDVLNPGATYFIEGQYVTPDDAQAGNGADNVSYREVRVQSDNDLVFEAPTVAGVGAIYAWQEIDPDVTIVDTDIANDGRITVASRATDLGGGQWHYEYAVHNINSHRSVGSFEVPLPSGATVTNVGFHDVDYHSGEPFDGTDWPATVTGSSISWETDDFATNENANALRWGTMYNFRFDADAAPGNVTVDLGLFRPGTPADFGTVALGPAGAIDDPTLNLSGTCPGSVTVTLDGLTPNGSVAFVSGTGPGTTIVPQGNCLGTELDVANGALVIVVTADGSGIFNVTRDLGGGLCGLSLQAVDLTSCDVSNVVELP